MKVLIRLAWNISKFYFFPFIYKRFYQNCELQSEITFERKLILTFCKKPLFPLMELFQITQSENFHPDPPYRLNLLLRLIYYKWLKSWLKLVVIYSWFLSYYYLMLLCLIYYKLLEKCKYNMTEYLPLYFWSLWDYSKGMTIIAFFFVLTTWLTAWSTSI